MKNTHLERLRITFAVAYIFNLNRKSSAESFLHVGLSNDLGYF